jgi:hypothetical protein
MRGISKGEGKRGDEGMRVRGSIGTVLQDVNVMKLDEMR